MLHSNRIRDHAGLIVRLALFVAVLLAASRAASWVLAQLDFELRPSTEPLLHRTIMIATAVYIGLLALPFVPGIEIGLTLMAMFGPPIVPLVYAATVAALVLAFLAGRLIPARTILELLELLRLDRARRLLLDIEPLDAEHRLRFLLQHAPGRLVPFLLEHRYVAVAVALNTPGNAIIGGGGGIGFAAGFSRLFSLPKFIALVCVAISPLPLMILLTG